MKRGDERIFCIELEEDGYALWCYISDWLTSPNMSFVGDESPQELGSKGFCM